MDFNDPCALTDINSWIKNKIRGKIEKIVDLISLDSVLFLINAIYFNGKWTEAFDAKNGWYSLGIHRRRHREKHTVFDRERIIGR